MQNINSLVKNINTNDEFVWDKLHYKVILFRNGDPVSYINLRDEENNMESAALKADKLIRGGGRKLG